METTLLTQHDWQDEDKRAFALKKQKTNKQKISCGFTIEILPQTFKIKCRMYKRE